MANHDYECLGDACVLRDAGDPISVPTYEMAWMLTLQDCIAMCDLDEAEILAIAEHEHIPEIAAAALGQYLLSREHGAQTIRDMLRDDIRTALRRDDRTHARHLLLALHHFLSTHPEAIPHKRTTPSC